MTEDRSNCTVPIVHKAGDVVPEHGDIAHWWKNTGKTKAVLLSGDILPPQATKTCSWGRRFGSPDGRTFLDLK